MNNEQRARAALKALIKRAGGVRPLANELGISRQAVEVWEVIPLNRLADTKRIYGLGLQELRPDIAEYL